MISVEKVTKKFEQFTALDDVTFKIDEGCIYGLVGSNGAGKSTLLRVLTGIYKPESGCAFIDDANVYENPAVKEKSVFIGDDLFFLSGASMNKMAVLYKSIYDDFDMERFKSLTKLFGLDPTKSVYNFSKGMRRQAAIILALSTKAKYMFFDETFDGLDPVMRNLVKKLICEDVLEREATVIITSHSLRELEDICDHLALLHKGGLVLDSDISDLKTSHYKVQIAFKEEYDESKFEGMNISRFRKSGSVTNMIIMGDREENLEKLQAMNPVVLDVLPLTLEEVFTYELEALGYEFNIDGEVSENEQ